MDDAKLVVGASVASRVQEFREFYELGNPGRLLALGAGVGGTYDRISEVVEDKDFFKSTWAVMEEWAGSALEKKTGLEIKEISEAGLARAIGRRAGFELNSLHDTDVIMADLIAAAAEKIGERFLKGGFGRRITSAEQMFSALERRAAAEIEKRVDGLVLHDLTSAAITEDDVARWAAAKITQKTGIPLRDIRDPDKTKQDLIRWAEPELRKRMGVSGSAIGGGLKMTKKAIRNRLSQRRFYEAWGSRKQYERLSTE